MVSYELFESHLIDRHGIDVHKKVKHAVIGIGGLGGLGSNIALSLARLGVGKLLLIDFDHVEISNINRQAYFLRHIGVHKTKAIVELIKEVNPFVEIETVDTYINRENALSYFKDVDIVVEAFDNPASKAALTEVILTKTDKPLVAASGMAGALSSNSILTEKIRKNFYLCGDRVTDSRAGHGLMAPRVTIAAGHQANMVLRLILGERDV